eukprot:TRINITY_DN565_c0_g1_i1.p1 TRINITY_DN565_c0_g1~~TRINITY_DN565_c0_g1_i1.p1  ORF type:complete len:448 (+),score=136.22 TRINITY_DN565_c0_g1_i1:72-1415(+)
MAAAPELGVVDRGVAQDDADLAARAVLVPNLDARLVQIEADKGVDRFHVLQGLEDPESTAGPSRFYFFERWGETGGRGASNLQGPWTAPKVEFKMRDVFLEKTGHKWGEVEPGHEAKEGMYWLQKVAKVDADAMWQYYVSDGVDGKPPGWYAYTEEAVLEMEDLYAQHVGNECAERTATRVIKSGYFSYTVDLAAMTQTNTRTNKQRDLRRVFGQEHADAGPKEGRPAIVVPKKAMKAAPARAMKAMKEATPRAKKLPRKTKAVVTKGPVLTKFSSSSLSKAKSAPKLKSASSLSKAKSGSAPKLPAPKITKKPMKAMKAAAKKSASATLASKSKAELKPMKAGKKVKVAKKSKVAKKGKMAKYQVFSGRKVRTCGGLRKDDIEKNKWGVLVPKRKAAAQRKNTWMMATAAAMKELGYTGFCPCGGTTAKGKTLYEKAKELHAKMPK